MSVRLRSTLMAVLLATLAIAVSSAVLVTTLRDSLIDAADDSSRARARQLIAAYEEEDHLKNPITDIAEGGVAQVFDEEKRKVVAASDNIQGAPRLTDDKPKEGELVRMVIRNAPDDDETEDYRVWAAGGDEVTAYVGTSLESGREVILDLTRYLIIGLPLLIAVFAAGTWFMVGRTLRPVEDIRAEVSAITHRRLDRRVPVPATHDEVGRLAVTMNEMLGRLEGAATRERDFVGNASHELRSPLAAFRTQLEVAAAHPDGVDWTSLAASLLADTNRMEGLVHDLLFLAREDAEDPRPMKPVDLDDVVLEEVARMRSTCSVEVHTGAVGGAPLLGHSDDLAWLVRNLLDNACRYASSRVDVSLATEDGRVELTVADDGPGVAPEDRPRIFDRFYRADPVRNRYTSGTGLGLAIAAAVAEAHDGTIEVQDGNPGARFVVSLPVMQ